MPKIKPTPSKVFTAENQTALIKVINSLWGMQIDTITQDRVIRALELQGLPNEWLDELTQNVDFFIDHQFTPTIVGKVEVVGSATAYMVGEAIDATISYEFGSNAISFVNSEMENLLNNIKNPLNDNVIDVLRSSIDNNWGISQTEEMMRSALNLTTRDNRAVINFMAHLPKDTTDKQRIAMGKQYYLKLRRLRSERIAQTELIRVKHFGEIDALNQSIANGNIKEATKLWVKTNMKDNWDSSIINDGVEVGLNEGFPEPCATGNDQYPSEIKEYCYLEYPIKI